MFFYFDAFTQLRPADAAGVSSYRCRSIFEHLERWKHGALRAVLRDRSI